jgi:hypothetical protein
MKPVPVVSTLPAAGAAAPAPVPDRKPYQAPQLAPLGSFASRTLEGGSVSFDTNETRGRA